LKRYCGPPESERRTSGEQTCTANSHEHLPSGNQKRF
jgi:hypothetical protein